MITPQNLVKHELIGLHVQITKSSDKSTEGLEGDIVDETRQTFVVRTKTAEKTVIKDQCVFLFCLPTGVCVQVDGKILVARPEDRIKKKFKMW